MVRYYLLDNRREEFVGASTLYGFLEELTTFLAKIRKYYPESAVDEVVTLFRSMVNPTNTRAKDFAKEFWKTHKDMLNINRVQLEDETVESMRELAGNLTYFG
eukprot:TRINITY_DN2503_c0_g2_i2.p1 TRINITY_DN2503_c0_g2~~TRINITY_DN2503_c0_g2_i2.p1  ORF type:complete len:103 (+),score=22.87 TRINITY_DN2503_c0_g2_i2:242-550(+)